MKHTSAPGISWVLVASLLMMAGLPRLCPSEELQPASSFDDLTGRVPLGDMVFVKLKGGRTIAGELLDITDSDLTVRTRSTPMKISTDEILSLKRRYTDSFREGLIAGSLAGACAGVALVGTSTEGGEGGFGHVLPFVLIGAVIGLGVDAAHLGQQFVYQAPEQTKPVTVGVAPTLSNSRRGFAVTLRF